MGELGRGQIHVCLDVISIFWIAVAFMEFVYLMGFVDQNLTIAVKGLIGFSLLVGGLALSFHPSGGVGIVLDTWISVDETIEWFANVFLTFVVILLMNAFVKSATGALSTTYLPDLVFVMLIGISEEPAIRGWLLNLLDNFTGVTFVANFISSAIGATLHAGIYGARDLRVIGVVFLSFFIIGYIYSSSTTLIKGPWKDQPVRARRLSSVMTGHGLVNLMAMARGSVVAVNLMALLAKRVI